MIPRRAGASAGLLVAVVLAAAPAAGAQSTATSRAETKWVVDLVHSQVEFRVRHMVGRVRGTFTRWYALLVTEDAGWKHGRVNVTVQTASLSTGNAIRDDDLRSDRFFAVSRFPTMTFQGNGFAATDSTVEISGILTIKGRSKPVVFSGQYLGIAKDREGHQRIAFEATSVVDRRDFDMTWNESVAGREIIGNEVEITIAIEAVQVDRPPKRD